MKKILFASVDIGWRISNYSSFLYKRFGSNILIRSFIKRALPKQQYNTSYDYTFYFHKYPAFLQWLIAFSFFLYSLVRFNTFYFLSGETLLTRKTRKWEFKLYRLFGKKVIMHFVGSDIRDPAYLFWKDQNMHAFLSQKASRKKTANWQDKLIADSEEFASSILVSTPDLLKLIPSAHYYPVVIDVNKFLNELKEHGSKNKLLFKTNKVKILHAPSNIKLKGSAMVADTIKRLAESDNRIEFIYTKDLNRNTGLVYTVSRYELFQLYEEADIVIDQMVIGWYGLQSVEALLAGCQVLCYIEEDLKSHLFPDCPIIASNVLTLENDIKKAIQLFIDNKVDVEKQLEWVKKYHSIERNNKVFLNAIED